MDVLSQRNKAAEKLRPKLYIDGSTDEQKRGSQAKDKETQLGDELKNLSGDRNLENIIYSKTWARCHGFNTNVKLRCF